MAQMSGYFSYNLNNHEPPSHVRNVPLEFPRFDIFDALGWIFKAGQLFNYHRTPELESLTFAAVHFNQKVIHGFHMMQREVPFLSWQTLIS